MLKNGLNVEHQLLHGVGRVGHSQGIGHERMPMIEMIEFHVNAIVVLEIGAFQQTRFVLQLELVAAQVMQVVFDRYLQIFTFFFK